jgi:hypothetical protein
MCDTDGTDCSYIHVTRVTATTTGKEAAECIQSRRVCVCVMMRVKPISPSSTTTVGCSVLWSEREIEEEDKLDNREMLEFLGLQQLELSESGT